MTPDQFQSQLSAIVQEGTKNTLMYGSENDFPVKVVRLKWWRLWYLSKNTSGGPLINQGLKSEDRKLSARWSKLYWLISGHDFRQIKRPTSEPGKVAYYFVVRFRFEYVGVKCYAIET